MPLSIRTLMMLMVVFLVHLSLLDNQRVVGLKCSLCGYDPPKGDQVSKPCNLDGIATETEECDTDHAYCREELYVRLDPERPGYGWWIKSCGSEGKRQDAIKRGVSCDKYKYSEDNTVKSKVCYCSTDLCNNHLSLIDPVTTTTAASQITTEAATSDAPSIITGCSRLLMMRISSALSLLIYLSKDYSGIYLFIRNDSLHRLSL